jgi:hypothetical protein
MQGITNGSGLCFEPSTQMPEQSGRVKTTYQRWEKCHRKSLYFDFQDENPIIEVVQ